MLISGQSKDLHSIYGVHRYSDRGLLGVCGSLDNPRISIVCIIYEWKVDVFFMDTLTFLTCHGVINWI